MCHYLNAILPFLIVVSFSASGAARKRHNPSVQRVSRSRCKTATVAFATTKKENAQKNTKSKISFFLIMNCYSSVACARAKTFATTSPASAESSHPA